MKNVFETLKTYYLKNGVIMPIDIFRAEFSSKHCTSDELVEGVFKFNDFLNQERVNKLELLKSVNVKRQILIDRLITKGLNESIDHRPFQHLTLSELESEWQRFEEQKGVTKNG